MKCGIFVLVIQQIIFANGRINRQYPIAGIFNSESLSSSKEAFAGIVKLKGDNAYHSRDPIELQVVDSYSTALELCPLTSNQRGIASLIDARPTYGTCDAVCLLCNRLHITHLLVSRDLPETLGQDSYTFSYYPPPEITSKAFSMLIKKMQWKKFTIFYEDDGSFIRLKEIIDSWPTKMEPILFKKLDPELDNRETFKYVFKVTHMSNIIIDCDVNNVRKYFNQILEVENSTEYQSFILTNLDAYTVDLQDLKAFRANVTTMHLTRANDDRWKDLKMDSTNVMLERALTADALSHLEKAIRSVIGDGSNEVENPPGLCFQESKASYEEMAWSGGTDLRDALLKVTSEGFTGNIEFDEEGKRTNVIMHYSKLSVNSFEHAGYWDSKTDMIIDENAVEDRSSAPDANKKHRIIAKRGKPYFDYKEVNGTIVYEGYAVDLATAIFGVINKNEFKLDFEFVKVENDHYGHNIEGTDRWDGLIGQLIEHNAELAICDITITSERNAVVDFSTPFMSLGISMLFKEPEPEAPNMFSFINPLAFEVWLYLATTYIIVSFVLLICARMSQEDWTNPHPCNQNPENLQNIWSLYNCMWLTMGSIMTQGCDILPRAAGSRWITGMWWFFALIVTATYTANMSTFLSNDRRSNEISDVKELTEQNRVSYGAVTNASTYKFFESSNDSVYQKIWSVMKSAKPPVFTDTNDAGKERVKRSKGKYAFFMESTAIEYYLKRDCELKMVGSKLDSKEYGVAMPKNYPHKGLIDIAILSLQESGKLDLLKNKWWEDTENKCEKTDSDEDDSGSLQMKNTSGIFLVLFLGGVLGIIVATIDFLMHARQIAVKEKVTFREALASEWKASLDPRQMSKPVAPPRSTAPSTASPSPERERSQSRAVSVLRAASSFINFDEIY